MHNKAGKNPKQSVKDASKRGQKRKQAAPPRTLVLVHGLGGGLGLWSKNLVDLTAHFDVVYAFDLLGFGRSSRPVPPAGSPTRVQAWWVESLENWREAMEIEQPFEMCGHSLGAPCDISCELRFPNDFNCTCTDAKASKP